MNWPEPSEFTVNQRHSSFTGFKYNFNFSISLVNKRAGTMGKKIVPSLGKGL